MEWGKLVCSLNALFARNARVHVQSRRFQVNGKSLESPISTSQNHDKTMRCIAATINESAEVVLQSLLEYAST